MLNNWLKRVRRLPDTQERTIPPYCAVAQVGTYALLDLRRNVSASIFLSKCFPDTFFFDSVNQPNYTHSFFLLNVPPAQYPEWTYDRKAKLFHKTRSDLVTDSLRELSRFVCAKGDSVTRIIHAIHSARIRKTTGMIFQEDIYMVKRIEALRFRDSGYDEREALHYPYLQQYSEFADSSLREAADEILFKASIYDDEMVKTEFLRMKYFKRIQDAKTIEELPSIEEEFKNDLYITARI